MRLAVAMPALEPQALHCRALEETLRELAAAGTEIEGFVEHDRLARGEIGFPLYHYLRFGERHRDRPFDLSLYPVGRDSAPFQAPLWLLQQYPGVLWLLDPMAHHIALGGFALWGEWTCYRDHLRSAYGDAAAAIAQTVSGSWGTDSVFDTYDLVGMLAQNQRGVVAAWPALARRLEARLGDEGRPGSEAAGSETQGFEVASVELPLLDEDEPWRTAGSSRGLKRVTIVSLTSSDPAAGVAVAEEMLRRSDDAHVTICTSTSAHRGGAAASAHRRGIAERVDWVLDPGWVELAAESRRADMLVWLNHDLRAGERLLLLHGMAAGKPTIVPRSQLYEDLPEGAVARLDPGRSLGPEAGAVFGELGNDGDLLAGMRSAARAFTAGLPDAGGAATALRRALQPIAASGPTEEVLISAPVWQALGDDMNLHAIPSGAAAATRRMVDEMLADATRVSAENTTE